jgi:hypothetical protein
MEGKAVALDQEAAKSRLRLGPHRLTVIAPRLSPEALRQKLLQAEQP